MPAYDGTGPRGRGPLTGRGRGYCVLSQPDDRPDQVDGLAGVQGTPIRRFGWGGFLRFARTGFRRGLGRGRGRGRGRFGF